MKINQVLCMLFIVNLCQLEYKPHMDKSLYVSFPDVSQAV